MPRRARAGDGLAAALKRVVKSVETTLGAVITEAEGQDLFDVVEAVRLDFVPSREDSGPNPASHQPPPDARGQVGRRGVGRCWGHRSRRCSGGPTASLERRAL